MELTLPSLSVLNQPCIGLIASSGIHRAASSLAKAISRQRYKLLMVYCVAKMPGGNKDIGQSAAGDKRHSHSASIVCSSGPFASSDHDATNSFIANSRFS